MKKHILPARLLAIATAIFLGASVPQEVTAKPPAPATPTVDVKTGMTSLVLSETFNAALTTLGTTTRKIIPGQFVKGRQTHRFPIRGGAFDTETLQAEILHSGGVNLSSTTVAVSLTDFIITLPAPVEEPPVDPNAPPVDPNEPPVEPPPGPSLSALVTVNGHLLGRISLFTLDLTGTGLAKPHQMPKNKKLTLDGVALTLSAEGAAALNAAFAITTLLEGDSVGTLSVNAITARRTL
jgi:hypothetical protein